MLPAGLSGLWHCILNGSHQGASERIRKHPHEARLAFPECGILPLHAVLIDRTASPQLIHEVMQAYPQAASVADPAGQQVPIALAIFMCQPIEVFMEILDTAPETAAWVSPTGDNLLDCILSEATPEELRALDSAAPEATSTELSRKIHRILFEMARIHELNTTDLVGTGTDAGDATKPTGAPCQHSDTVLYVHAACCFGPLHCPVHVLDHVLRQHPEQANRVDRHGRHALHIAVLQPNCLPGPRDLTNDEANCRERAFMTRLLQANSLAAEVPIRTPEIGADERSPLVEAIKNGQVWEGGIKVLSDASPDAKLLVDPATGLLPFQLAALPSESARPNISTIFSLLIEQPHEILNEAQSHAVASQGE